MAEALLPRTRNTLAAVGLLLLLVGFAAGYYAGSQARPEGPALSASPGSAVSTLSASAPAPHRGHTFTGNIEVPPHSDEAHQLADRLLADVPCPCGGCTNQTVGQCGCDTAREIGGIAAHLLERGKTGDAVLRQLQPRYGLTLTDAVLTAAAQVKLPNPQFAEGGAEGAPPAGPAAGGAGSVVPSDLAALGALTESGINRPSDVPTDARPKTPPAGLAATILDPSLFSGAAAQAYAVARQMPETLQALPCACGCMMKLGHGSLLSCYQGNHASTCPICQAEAQEAARLASQGLALEAIQARVKADFRIQ